MAEASPRMATLVITLPLHQAIWLQGRVTDSKKRAFLDGKRSGGYRSISAVLREIVDDAVARLPPINTSGF